ncbi:MAG: tRNA isopentenyl-2-thiomethyl-A-37 hydroxylase MiaE [Steroidobacteraceae bacterium]
MNAALAATLRAPTAATWFQRAAENWRELLLDHANCEKKAASTALSLIFTYADDMSLCTQLSKLAREELKHFEQVQKMMRVLGVPFARMSPARYAEGLRRAMRRDDPERLLDLLICGALIEARSCERFEGLIAQLSSPLRELYSDLAHSEARHHLMYLRLAEERFGAPAMQGALARLSTVEAELATGPDAEFRFHSGTPPATT